MAEDFEITTRGEARFVLIGMLVALAVVIFFFGWIAGWFRLSPLSPMEVEAAEAQEWIIGQGFPCEKPTYFLIDPFNPRNMGIAKLRLHGRYLFKCAGDDLVETYYYSVRTAAPYPGKVEGITFEEYQELVAIEKLRRVWEKAR